MGQNFKVILGIFLIVGLVFGFIQGSQEKEKALSPKEQMFKSLLDKGVYIETYMITDGREAKKAFFIEDIDIPDDDRILYVSFRMLGSDRGLDRDIDIDDYLNAVREIVYQNLDVDADLDGIIVFRNDPNRISKDLTFIYSNRSYAEELRDQNLTVRTWYNRMHHINVESSKFISDDKSRDIILSALLKTGMKINGVMITNSEDIKTKFNLNDTELLNDSKVAFIAFEPSGNETMEIVRAYIDIIFTAFSVDPSIDVVMATNAGPSNRSYRTSLVYSDRDTVERLMGGNRSAVEIFNEFKMGNIVIGPG